MREIRARIAQRHGIDLSQQQIQELAARRLEAILDPRTVKPSLLEQLRKSAGDTIEPGTGATPLYTFEDSTLYESHNGFLRFIRRLLNPVLKLFFNPNPLIQALNTQARLNAELAKREEERDRRQAEWNALHYTLLQRVVLEISRTSIDAQNLAARVEALGTRVDFADRRVRVLEGAPAPVVTPRLSEPLPHASGHPPAAQSSSPVNRPAVGAEGAAADGSGDGTRKRRRRRRGRRSGVPGEGAPATTESGGRGSVDGADGPDGDDDADVPEYRELPPPPPQALRPVVATAGADFPLPDSSPESPPDAGGDVALAPQRDLPIVPQIVPMAPQSVALVSSPEVKDSGGGDSTDPAAMSPEGPLTPSGTSLEPTDR
jgi:hypothetical protein